MALKSVLLPLEGWLKLWVLWLLLIAFQGWFLYRPFVDGWLPGIYALAEVYSAVGAIPMGLLSIGFISFIPLLLGVLLAVCFLGWWRCSQRYWQSLVRVVLLLLLVVGAFAPTLQGLSARSSLTIESWNRVYRMAYVLDRMTYVLDRMTYGGWPIDINYDQLLVMECNRTGQLCRTAYQDSAGFDSFLLESGKNRL
ncbi:MAG: hypothetical protein AAGC93_16740 [Cyanobacteria bacterium P01_F01_bin.53]